jgi:hypothetical protein
MEPPTAESGWPEAHHILVFRRNRPKRLEAVTAYGAMLITWRQLVVRRQAVVQGRRRLGLRSGRQDTGVLEGIKPALASLAADAGLTRSPRARVVALTGAPRRGVRVLPRSIPNCKKRIASGTVSLCF